ncbi:OmpA family protein [Porphyromonas sp.]
MKSLLLALSLFSISSVALAQSAGRSVSQPYSSADTLITLSEDDLRRAVRTVAEARLAAGAQQSFHGFRAEDLRLVKLQMLLGALGLSGATPAHSMPMATNAVSCPDATCPAYQAQPQGSTARLDRLEQMLLLLLQRREPERSTLVLPTRSAKGQSQASPQRIIVDNSSSDSLLRVLQQEIIALRASQQPTAEPARPVAVKPAPSVSVAVSEPEPTLQPQPVESLAQPQTVVRTDTVVVSYFKRQVFFPLGKSELLPEARLTLNEVYRVLSTDPAMKLYLTGYSSPDGNAAQNERLSRLRSQSVLDYLTACGISADRLISVAGGVDRNTDLKSSARRVDIELKK